MTNSKHIIAKCRNISKPQKALIIALVILTVFRIWLGLRTPLLLQGGAGYDDFLLVKYAARILQGDWLGTFNVLTLAKGVSFPFFLVFTYLSGISYSLLLICLYIFSLFILI